MSERELEIEHFRINLYIENYIIDILLYLKGKCPISQIKNPFKGNRLELARKLKILSIINSLIKQGLTLLKRYIILSLNF